MQALGTPTSNDLKALIRMNVIRNCNINTEDVNLADKAYGKDVGAVKGKSTRVNPSPITSNLIELPDELVNVQEDMTMSTDGLEVNTVKFLTTVAHDSHHRTS